jgi:hypothetical protein
LIIMVFDVVIEKHSGLLMSRDLSIRFNLLRLYTDLLYKVLSKKKALQQLRRSEGRR